MTSYYLKLLKNPLNFPPVSKEVNVFFDECNKQVFAVASQDGQTSVNVKGPDNKPDANFKLPEKGNVISIKFSPDQRILAIQRSCKTIDFLNFYEGANTAEYSQSCKGRSTQIKGFCWTGVNNIVFVTNQGIEFYQTSPDQSSLKLLKNYHAPVNWFVYLPESSVLLLSSGIMGNVIHPYIFKHSNILRLPKFEVENPPSTRNPQPGSLLERDVTVANIYNNIYVVILRNQPRCFNSIGAEIVLYQLQKDAPAKKSAVLRLGVVGRFAVNVVDNLVAVHHQATKTSMIFDIYLAGDYDGQVTHYHPVLSPLPIEPFSIQVGELTVTDSSNESRTVMCESYSPNWVVFQPNIIIDAKLACLWKLNVNLISLIDMMEDKGKLIDFLLLRSESKSVILSVCNQLLIPGQQSTIGVTALIFDKLNAVYAEYLELNNTGTVQVNDATKENELTGHWFQKESVIFQDDMYKNVFLPFIDLEDVSHKFVIAVLLEYIRSLNHHKITVEYYLNDFIIDLLAKHSLYYQLHQFIQYYILNDSKLLACKLLTLESSYAPAYDLALDMMKRLGEDAQEEIVETLIKKNEIIVALKFLQNSDRTDSAVARKFIAASLKADDDFLFYTVFTFFQQRNYQQRKSTKFVRGEQCEEYEKLFEQKFGPFDTVKKVESLIENMGITDL